MTPYIEEIEHLMKTLFCQLSEKDRRRYAAVEAQKLGWGGKDYISRLLGIDSRTICQGLADLRELKDPALGRIRRPGGGRKSIIDTTPELEPIFLEVISEHTAGNPQHDMVWTNLRPKAIAERITTRGIAVSRYVACKLLKKNKFVRRQAQKKKSFKQHPDRNPQFENITKLKAEYLARKQPVISMDTKKKEMIGNFYREGKLYTREIVEVLDHDFPSYGEGKIGNRSLPLYRCRDGGERGERQTLARGSDDRAEVAPGGGAATAAGFDDAGQESEGARALFGASTVADIARNDPVAQRLFGGVVGERQVGVADRAQDHLPVVEEFAHDAAQPLVVIHPMHFAQVPQPFEIFFNVLKNGCRVEALQLGHIDKIELALAVYMVVAWRLAHLVRLGRTHPDLSACEWFSEEEWKGAYLLAEKEPPSTPPNLREMIRQIAMLGGFLGRKGDGEPGVKTLWLGFARLRDFVRGVEFMRSVHDE
ncbi:MAG: ISAzo13 family transposase [Candidatus Accumulibacter sp.]|nr:ISAzo13 family transposase [Accumulibacter sp.]